MQFSLFKPTAEPLGFSQRRNDVRTGKSGEHLVLAKLTRWGYDAHDAPPDAAYDIIVDYKGRVLRLQVKTRSQPAGSCWSYRVQRGNWRSATGTYAYSAADYDIFAAVANSIERVLFVPGVVHATTFRTADFLQPGADEHSWNQALDQAVKKPSL